MGGGEMDWLQILISGAAGALGGLIGMLLTRGAESGRSRAGGIIVALIVSQVLAQSVMPSVKAWNYARNLDAELQKQPVFQVIKRYEAGNYGEMVLRLKREIKNGANPAQVVSIGRASVVKILEKRLPTASNAAVANYLRVLLNELTVLQSQDPVLCYNFVFPRKSSPVDLQKYVPKDLRDADFAALAQVITTSAEQNNQAPWEAEAGPLFKNVITQVANEYGRDVAMLATPYAASVSPAKMCQMTVSIYSKIAKLPDEDAGKVMRYLVSQTATE